MSLVGTKYSCFWIALGEQMTQVCSLDFLSHSVTALYTIEVLSSLDVVLKC